MSLHKLLDDTRLPGDWRLLRFASAEHAAQARPGQQLRVDFCPQPLTITATRPSDAWLATLLPPSLAQSCPPGKPNQSCRIEELIGEPLPEPQRPAILLGEESGIGAILFLAERLSTPPHLVLLGARLGLPFRPRPSSFLLPAMPGNVIAAAPQLETRGIPSRLACETETPGCHEGTADQLLAQWLNTEPLGAPLIAAGPFGLKQRLPVGDEQHPVIVRLLA